VSAPASRPTRPGGGRSGALRPGSRSRGAAAALWVVVACVLVATPAAAQHAVADAGAEAAPAPSSAASRPAGTETPAPAAPGVSLAEIGARAEQTAGELRRMADSVVQTADLAALTDSVDRNASQVAASWTETAGLLGGEPRLSEVDALLSAWEALRVDLGRLGRELDALTRAREAANNALADMRKSWTTTLEEAKRTQAPAAVVARAQATLAAIDATGSLVDRRNDRLLVLQDSVSRSRQGCDDAIARLHEARNEVLRRMLSSREPGLWRLGRAAFAIHDLPASLRTHATERIARGGSDLALYVGAHRPGFVLMSVLAFVLVALMMRARGRIDVLAARDPLLAAHSAVFRSPIAAGLLVAIVVTRPLRPDPPLELGEILLFAAIPAVIAVLRPLVDASTARLLYALAGLFVFELAREFLRLPVSMEQLPLVVELAAVTWVLRRLARRVGGPQGAPIFGSPWLRRTGRSALRLLTFAAGAAAFAAFVGYLALADFVGRGALFLAYLTFGLFAFRAAADALVTLGLLTGPAARIRSVHGHRALVERRVGGVLDLVVAALWITTALQLFELSDFARVQVASLLHVRVQVGGLDFTIGRVLAFPVVVVAAYLVSRLVVFAFEQDLYPRLALPRGVPYALSSLTRYGVLLLGFLLALAALGLDLTRLTVMVSAFGLGLGFGLQQIVNNFVSGLILLFERPLQVGDRIQLGDLLGEVLRIGIRSSSIHTFDGAEVIVPNSSMIQEKVTNWTLSNRRRRLDVDVGVAYGTDAKRVLALLLDVARENPGVRSDPEPEALFVGFGDSSLGFQLRIWTEDPRWWRLRSDLAVALQAALKEAGIEVPFPQRDLHIRSLPAGSAPNPDPLPDPEAPR
jgi:potassium efflux system protein